MRLAVIPARGGSKRIPRKNIRDFCGHPMIAWPINAAKASGLFDHIVVSTEDPEIAAVAQAWGGSAPFVRPLELADDLTGNTDVIAHATRWGLDQGWPLQSVCCIYATAALLDSADLTTGLAALDNGPWSYAFSVTDFASTIFRSFRVEPDGSVGMFFPDKFATRSQDLPKAYHDAAQFYWGRPEAWLRGDRIFDRHSVAVPIPRWRVQDIDDPDDWTRAEMLFKMLGKTSEVPSSQAP